MLMMSARHTYQRSSIMEIPDARIVIVGAGFAGIEVARALQKSRARVTVIDRNNYSLFQPLLYQVATAALSPGDVAVPIRALVHGPGMEVVLDEVTAVDPGASVVKTASGRDFPYDILVLAAGSTYNYFGHDDWRQTAIGPKTLNDALAIRRRLLLAFERAETCADEAERRALMTFVIVGGGPTGVEVAGAIAELAKASLVRDFRHIDTASARILLVEAGPRLLPSFDPHLGDYAKMALEKIGVETRLDTRIEDVDEDGVVANGERIRSKVVIWGAGVKANPVAGWLGVEPAKGGQGSVAVAPDFSLKQFPNIHVIGDAAHLIAPDGKPFPKLAAVAKQEGQYLGRLLRDRLAGRVTGRPFVYRDFGTMATIGRSSAIANLRGFNLKGLFAWLLWGAVHIYYLIGFRNRLVVLINWLWAWLTYARGARLLTGKE
jgi:NADH:quinone reductase (non-electrogenic)